MKLLVTLALAFAPLATAWAQEEPPPAEDKRATPGPALCVSQALEEASLSEHEAVLLCQGAESDAPVDCFLEASQRTFLQPHDILTLCSPTLSGRVRYPY